MTIEFRHRTALVCFITCFISFDSSLKNGQKLKMIIKQLLSFLVFCPENFLLIQL